MPDTAPCYLSPQGAKAYYDRFGRKQDWQRFYEGPALRDLVANGDFPAARAVMELGCGTGALAAELLTDLLPEDATYLGLDVSSTMVELSRGRLAPFGERASVRQTDGSLTFDLPDQSCDRFICVYVLDLLAPADIRAVLAEARRLLIPGGRLCAASLTPGPGGFSRLVTNLWARIAARHPEKVGGCRPTVLSEYIQPPRWRILHHNVITAFGVPSEIVVASNE